jgi:hypothetical protein
MAILPLSGDHGFTETECFPSRCTRVPEIRDFIQLQERHEIQHIILLRRKVLPFKKIFNWQKPITIQVFVNPGLPGQGVLVDRCVGNFTFEEFHRGIAHVPRLVDEAFGGLGQAVGRDNNVFKFKQGVVVF